MRVEFGEAVFCGTYFSFWKGLYMPKMGAFGWWICSQRRVRIARHPFDRFLFYFVLVGWLVCSCVTKVHTYEIDGSNERGLWKGTLCFCILEMARLMDERWGLDAFKFQFTTSLVCRTVHHCRRRRLCHPFYLCPSVWAFLSP